ncbi:stress protein [Paenibacillus melissococcoides]|uniref:Stress protein n=1 Tax=Paenibacillus melissococcoides TaxID=2912268 RepID=A0ABM9GAF3_9BACL|nr:MULTISPECIES: stress protein [Paenibacillus]MEB9892689.1 stress protein [Bacillus cereus]CAH8248640.1 stress protein [Paenibacillus melissococcoides]CAH8714166.1 stress protein [Paenibacillus melissococcoides]CAH8720066.1 stress protein [Paenibacillus melissococcoides]
MLKKLSAIFLMCVLVLVGCGGGKNISADEMVQKFKDAGLEIEARDLEAKEYGMAPKLDKESKRILVPALGEDNGGRLFIFDKTSDLEKVKTYYDELGKATAAAFSHTHAAGNVLLQMNGNMEKAEFEKYAKAMDEAVK